MEGSDASFGMRLGVLVTGVGMGAAVGAGLGWLGGDVTIGTTAGAVVGLLTALRWLLVTGEEERL